MRLNKKQTVALWIGFIAIVLLLHFPPPPPGQPEWPVFIYSSHKVVNQRLSNNQIVTQQGWQSPGLVDRLSLPIIAICVVTAGAYILLASPKMAYDSDPEYLRYLQNPPRGRDKR